MGIVIFLYSEVPIRDNRIPKLDTGWNHPLVIGYKAILIWNPEFQSIFHVFLTYGTITNKYAGVSNEMKW